MALKSLALAIMITAFEFIAVASSGEVGQADGQLASMQSPLDGAMPNINYPTTTTNATNNDALSITGIRNATAVNNQITKNTTEASVAPSNQTVQEEPQPMTPLLRQEQPSTSQPPQQQLQQQQETITPSSNATQAQQLQQQIPALGQVIQQQPLYQQPFTTQQQILPQPTTQQQQFFPSSPLTSPTATVQPQGAYYPPSSTTFPPTVFPPSSTALPSTIYPPVSTSPSTGLPMTAGGISGVAAASQIVSPWFPSLPAISCGGTFVMTIEGIPRGSDDSNGGDRITPSDDASGDNGDDDDKQYSGKSNRRLAVQINSDNSQIITDQQDPIFGQLFQGQKNIDQNKANDFDIRSIFNDCQVSTYSKLS